jgi:hypothetical protein
MRTEVGGSVIPLARQRGTFPDFANSHWRLFGCEGRYRTVRGNSSRSCHRRAWQHGRRAAQPSDPSNSALRTERSRFRTILARALDVQGCRSSPPKNPRSWAGGPPVSLRAGQVVVVSPILVQAAFDCALSSTVRGTPHTAGQGLLPGRRPFHHIPMEPPMQHHHRTTGLCRCCSGARTLARRVPTRPRVPRSGDFPQRPAVAGADHRQLPSTSWRGSGARSGPNRLPCRRGRGKRPRGVGSA